MQVSGKSCLTAACLALVTWHALALIAAASEPIPGKPPLAGTQPLTLAGDLSARLLDGAHRFVDGEIARSAKRRELLWSHPENTIAVMRARFTTAIGAIDTTKAPPTLEFMRRGRPSSLVAQHGAVEVHDVEWDVAESPEPAIRLTGSGLYLRPAVIASNRFVIVLGNANQTPESLHIQEPVLFADAGCHVFIPRLVSRETFASQMLVGARQTNLNHREYIYRQAFEVGRNVVGYEVATVRALVRWIRQQPSSDRAQIGVLGRGDGGMIALYTSAIEPEIDVTVVSDYFASHDRVWEEPPERNVWGRIAEFNDAELTRLILPRKLILDTDLGAPRAQTAPTAGPVKNAAPAKIDTAVHVPVAFAEAVRIPRELTKDALEVYENIHPSRLFSGEAFQAALKQILSVETVDTKNWQLRRGTTLVDGSAAKGLQQRLVDQMSAFTQAWIREAEYTRNATVAKHLKTNGSDASQWRATTAEWRQEFYDEVIGRFERDLAPFNARSRQIYDEEKYVGYELTLDVYDDVIAYGVLLVPKQLKPGERRPVVVCQHGLEGRPQDTIENNAGERYYHRFAAKLCERGFVTFAPQNLYLFKDRFRELQRKLNPLKKTLFSLIVPQHEQICRWLKTQPFVDGERIAFYGLSYGGKSAMRIPPLVDHYGPVICSGDFNDWIRKTTSIRDPFSYVGTGEYEIWEWNLAPRFNYAEMAALIAPRPFMVERGHRDGVGIDEWVDYEFAKVRRLYVDLKIADRTEIEHFDGPHEIHAVKTFEFLHRHLKWPE